MKPWFGFVLALALSALGCGRPIEAPTLSVQGTLERHGLDNTDTTAAAIDYSTEAPRVEWWPCDVRVTAKACADGFPVNVYVTKPGVSFSALGTGHCGEPGAYEGLRTDWLLAKSGAYEVGSEVEVFVLVGGDAGGQSAAVEFDDDNETFAVSQLASGTLQVRGAYEASLSFELTGKTHAGNEISIELNRGAASVADVPPPPKRSACPVGE